MTIFLKALVAWAGARSRVGGFLLMAGLGWAAGVAHAGSETTVPGGSPLRVVAEWTFDRAGDLEGWRPNGHLADVTVEGGALRCRGQGHDPILELQAPLAIPADPGQVIELRLKADRDGIGEIFWSDTTQGKYGGFSQEKSTRFQVRGDQAWHEYRIPPFWQVDRKIVRLRLDLYDGARFEVDALRVKEVQRGSASDGSRFDFASNAQGWRMISGQAAMADATGLVIPWADASDYAMSPLVRIPADENAWITVTMASSRGSQGRIGFATDRARGLQSVTFPIRSDGRLHTYNVDMLTAPEWRGQVVALTVFSGDVSPGAIDTHGLPETAPVARVSSLAVSDEPQGPPQLEFLSLALDDPMPRAGRKATLKAVVANRGGEAATNLQAELRLPAGLEVVGSAAKRQIIPQLGFDQEASVSWELRAPKAVHGRAEVRLWGQGVEPVTGAAPLEFLAKAGLGRAAYVPEPKPVRGPYEVGVYYFPGWQTASQWHPITKFPERKPMLGWYREGDPEVADWHIKWAVEHGITFFAYDWYWSQGARQLEHGLHQGYFQAKYRHLLKFCLLWANHNPPGSSSREDCLAVTRHWIASYFHQPEYLRIEGKPVVIIFSPDRLSSDLGSQQVKSALDLMREECRKAGLSGLYLMACVGDAGQARQVSAEGYDAVTAYTWPGLGISDGSLVAPFQSLLAGYRDNWKGVAEASAVPLGLPICGGWDSRPWHGYNNLVRFGRTPAVFEQHLADAKAYLDALPASMPLRRFALIEAWNEWGEGAYIEPQAEYGFGYLDAIRKVFVPSAGKHPDYSPADVGLGPYDVPPPAPGRTRWEAGGGLEEWANTMDLAKLQMGGDGLSFVTTGADPALFGPPTQASATEFKHVRVRMKLAKAGIGSFVDRAQLFWRTSRLPESEANSLRFEVMGDGAWHEYAIPVSSSRRWRGIVTRLRLDPCNQPGVSVEVGTIQFAK